MKSVNLLLHIQSIQLTSPLAMSFYARAESQMPSKTVKPSEEETLLSFVRFLFKEDEYELADGFYLNYTIPRISKEFDILRFSENAIINIEIKALASNARMKDQLIQNRSYLLPFGKPVYSFSFRLSDTMLFALKDEQLQPVSREYLRQILAKYPEDKAFRIESSFRPETYLISPFSSPERFLEHQYFLTSHQEMFIKTILSEKKSWYCVTGSYGTGKTLLLYDLAQKADKNHSVCIIHGGRLNPGQQKLIEAGMEILPMQRAIPFLRRQKRDFIIFDEAQRFPIQRFHELKELLDAQSAVVVFALDQHQILEEKEQSKESVIEQILQIEEIEVLPLTNRIRTNEQVSSFITSLFSLKKLHPTMRYSHICTAQADSLEQAKKILMFLEGQGYTFINYAPVQNRAIPYDQLRFSACHTGSVLGQEFDKVAVILDENFFYANSELQSANPLHLPYSLKDALYEQVSRTRSELFCLVINNPSVFEKIIWILSRALS